MQNLVRELRKRLSAHELERHILVYCLHLEYQLSGRCQTCPNYNVCGCVCVFDIVDTIDIVCTHRGTAVWHT